MVNDQIHDAIIGQEGQRASITSILPTQPILLFLGGDVDSDTPEARLGCETVLSILVSLGLSLWYDSIKDAWGIPVFKIERVRLL